jgi:hypothetical protein
MIRRAFSVRAPTTTRSGFWKSSSAAPSLRNSGLETTSTSTLAFRVTSSCTRSLVPTGTVLFSTSSVWWRAARATSSQASITWRSSASPWSPSGVPTATNTTRARPTAAARSVVNRSLPSLRLRPRSSSRPGS